MARIDPERIRNVALLGHSHDGKTSLAEAMLYAGGTVDRLGRPDAGNTTFDFEPEEVKRKISIGTAVAHLTWHDHKINLLDAPGFQDFAGEVVGALRAAEGALLVVGASTGVVVGTELGWQQLRDRNLPTLIVVNKMDKENADYWRALDSFKEFSPRPVSIQAPIAAPIERSNRVLRPVVRHIPIRALIRLPIPRQPSPALHSGSCATARPTGTRKVSRKATSTFR